MLITVQGKNEKKVGVAGLLASLTALKKSRSTLVIQLENKSHNSLENVMIGEVINSRSINGKDFASRMEKGIDALIRECLSTKLDGKMFVERCEALLVNKENMLDIACMSQKINFEKETLLTMDLLKKFLKEAQDVYEFVYAILPENDAFNKQLHQISNYNIYCVDQKQKKEYSLKSSDYLIVTDYEPSSILNLNYIKKIYGLLNVYTLPYNVGYRDQLIMKNVFDYARKNIALMKDDDNYYFLSSLSKLIGKLTAKKKVTENEEEKEDILPPKAAFKDEKLSLIELTPDLPEVNVKRKLFGKREITLDSIAVVDNYKKEVIEQGEESSMNQDTDITTAKIKTLEADVPKNQKGKKHLFAKKKEKSSEIQDKKIITATVSDDDLVSDELLPKEELPTTVQKELPIIISAKDIAITEKSILAKIYGEDVLPLIKQTRSSLVQSILYIVCYAENCKPQEISVVTFDKYICKMTLSKYKKISKKNIEAETTSLEFTMASKNAQSMVMKEIPLLGKRLQANGISLLGETIEKKTTK